jgi:NTE family protein
MDSNIYRVLVFQGGGSLGAYEAGAYKAIYDVLSTTFREEARKKVPAFHVVSSNKDLNPQS